MRVVQCSVDGCNHDAGVDIWLDDDGREFLCGHHHYESLASDWLTFQVRGRTLMLDTAGMWFFLPERDEGLHALAVERSKS